MGLEGTQGPVEEVQGEDDCGTPVDLGELIAYPNSGTFIGGSKLTTVVILTRAIKQRPYLKKKKKSKGKSGSLQWILNEGQG